MSAPAMVEAALAYARRGWALVPLVAGTKKPHVKTGRDHAEAASVEAEQVRAWWSRWPDAGVGIVPARSRLVVIDVDGEVGRESFRTHAGPFPCTCGSRSGREGVGFHLWYRVPKKAAVPRGRLLAPGLELKGAGNLVVAPPSLHRSGRLYAWDVPPARLAPQEAPGWILGPPTPPAPAPAPAPVVELGGATGTPYGVAALAPLLGEMAAATADRHTTLRRVARRLVALAEAGHLDWPEVRSRLELAAAHAWRGEDDPDEIASLLDWADGVRA